MATVNCPSCGGEVVVPEQHAPATEVFCEACKAETVAGPETPELELDVASLFDEEETRRKEHLERNEYYWSLLDDEETKRLTTPRPVRKRCPWCGCFNHAPMCRELHDAWMPKMPFGKHRGNKVDQVPPKYLKWWYMARIGDMDFLDQVEQVLEDTPYRVEPWEHREFDEQK